MSNSRCKTSLEGLSPSQGTVNHSFDARKVGFRWAIAAVTCNKFRQMPFEHASQEKKKYPIESQIDEQRPLETISVSIRCPCLQELKAPQLMF